MLRFVVDWLSGGDLPAIEVEPRVARDASAILEFLKRETALAGAPTPREVGLRFHRDEFSRLFEAVDGWPTVEFLTARGLPIDGFDDLPRSADGGIDLVVRITAPTERGARNIAGRIRNMIVNQRYE
jgi:hypothetical protein